MSGDEVQQPARGRPAARLLLQVGVVAHVAVERVEVVAGRQARLLDGAALDAFEKVAVLARAVVAGRQVGGPEAAAATAMAQLQTAVADPAGARVHGGREPIGTAKGPV